MEPDVISDYNCPWCKKKVDMQKRDIIASAPNLLILHLQRLGMDMETFAPKKLNDRMEFPNVLDLKPYSYHEIMKREGKARSEEERQAELNRIMGLSEEERAEALRSLEPPEDECFEYKLVGVNVHTGMADAGHYWSYINVNRSKPNDEDAD